MMCLLLAPGSIAPHMVAVAAPNATVVAVAVKSIAITFEMHASVAATAADAIILLLCNYCCYNCYYCF